MADSLAGGLLTVSGAADTLAALDANAAGALSRGATKIDYGSDPVRRVVILDEVRLVITGTLSIDPEKETLLVSSSAPNGTGSVPATDYAAPGAGGGIEIRSGGHLNVGTEDASGQDGTTYSAGEAVKIARKGTNASDVASAAMLGLPGSRVTLKGCTLNVAAACRFDGEQPAVVGPPPEARRAPCILRINDVVWYAGRDQSTGYFVPRLFTDDYQIDGLRLIGGVFQVQARKAGSYLRNIRVERSHGGVGVTGNSFGADTDFFEIAGLDGNHGSVTDANFFNGMKLRVKGSPKGTLVKVDLQSRSHPGRSYGVAEYGQDFELEVIDELTGLPVAGARVHAEDVVAGRQHANWSAKNVGLNQAGSPSTAVNYVNQRTYGKTTPVNGKALFDGTDYPVLGDMVYDARPASGQTLPRVPWRERGKTAVAGENILDWYVHSYLHAGALVPVSHVGEPLQRRRASLIRDPSITEQNVALVAAYAGIAVDHSTDIVTITAAFNLDQIYDWLKRDKASGLADVHPTRAGMVAEADGTILDTGGYGFVVAQNGALNAGTKFRSIRTTSTITSTGNGAINIGYQDSTGKSILVRLGAAQTAMVWDAGGAATWVAPSAATTARIVVPPASTVRLTCKRLGHDYRKYAVQAAHVAEVAVDLPRNLTVDTSDIIDTQNLLHWPANPAGVYGGNIYFEKNDPLPHVLRLGNVELTGTPVLTRALFDRRMTTQPAMEATHSHDDAARGRAYDVYSNRMRWDDAWLILGRQPITVPPNPAQGDGQGAGALWRVATWGLYVTRQDDIATLLPSRTDAYIVTIDPRGSPVLPTPAELARIAGRGADAAAAEVVADVQPLIDDVRDDVQAVSAQLKSLPIDELLQTDTVRHSLPLGGANIWSGIDGTAYALVAGAWQFDFRDTTRAESSNIAGGLDVEGMAQFAIAPPAGARTVLKVTLRCQALSGSTRRVSPFLSWEWTAPAAAIPERRALGHLLPTHPVSVLAPTDGLGPPTVVEYDMGEAAGFTCTDASLSIGAPIRSADEYLRVVITSVEWCTRASAGLDDFKANVDNLDVAVSTRLAAADYTDPPAGTVSAARAAKLDNLDRLDVYVGTRASQTSVNGLAGHWTEARGQKIDAIDTDVDTLLARLTADRAGRLDAAISTRLASDDLRINKLANMDAAVSTRASAADVQTLLARLTAARAALIDRLDAAVSSRATPADVPAAPDVSALARLDVAVSTRAQPSDIPAAPDLSTLEAKVLFLERMARASIRMDGDAQVWSEGGDDLVSFTRRPVPSDSRDWSGGRDE